MGARGGHDVTDHPGTGAPEAPATALHWAAKTQGTGTLTLTWDGQRGHWTVVVMNQDASPGLTVRAEAGMSAPALAWLAGEPLALGLLTGVVAGAMIVVSVRPGLGPGPRRDPAMTVSPDVATGGLTELAVRARVDVGQVNTIPPAPGRSLAQILRANVLTRFNAILGALFVVVLVIGPPQDALFGVVLVVNTGIGVAQELRAKRALDRLAILTARTGPGGQGRRRHRDRAGPHRDGRRPRTWPRGPGPRGRHGTGRQGLELDEALLTGEAKPVPKRPGDTVLSGSAVVAGACRIRADRVGGEAYTARLQAEARRFRLARPSTALPSAHPVSAIDPAATPCHSPMAPSVHIQARLAQASRRASLPSVMPAGRGRAAGTAHLRGQCPVRSARRRHQMNTDARPGLSVRAEAGLSALALSWLAGELLGVGLLTGVTAAALIVVPVRLASGRGPGATPP